MSEPKRTAGEWRIVTGEDALPNRWAVESIDGHKVCTVESYPSATTGRADAELIASAPSLLADNERLREALELAQSTIQRLTVNHGQFSSTKGTLDVIHAALSATERSGK